MTLIWRIDPGHDLKKLVVDFVCKWVFPKNRGGPPKWMVKIMVPKPYVQMDDLGGFLIFLECR